MNNITLRKPQRTSSLNDVSIFTNNSTLFETTVLSLPNSSLDESHTSKDLFNTINKLREQLESANNEIETLSLENSRLSKELEKSNKIIELYKKLGISESLCNSPLPVMKSKAKTRRNSNPSRICETPVRCTGMKIKEQNSGPINKCKNSTKEIHQENIREKSKDIITIDTKTTKAKFNWKEQQINPGYRSPSANTKPRRRIIIVADQQGRYLRSTLESLVGPEYVVESTFKPGGKFRHILCSQEEELRNLNKNDYIILLGGTNDTNPYEFQSHLNSFLTNIKNPNIIVCELPHNPSLCIKKMNNDLKSICDKFDNAHFINMGYSRYMPKKNIFLRHKATNILRDIIRLDYKYKLCNQNNYTQNPKVPDYLIRKYTMTDKSTQTETVTQKNITDTQTDIGQVRAIVNKELFRV